MEENGKGLLNGHEYVDLGLSVMWATCNIGANKPEEYGDYYAWGETKPKEEYTEENCKTWEKSMGDISDNACYDAARANWGGNWRMPTKKEFNELLLDNCDWKWTTLNGVSGYRVTGKNGNSIFLPAAGWRNGGVIAPHRRRVRQLLGFHARRGRYPVRVQPRLRHLLRSLLELEQPLPRAICPAGLRILSGAHLIYLFWAFKNPEYCDTRL